MKFLLAVPLALASLAAQAQDSWPRNPQTGKVEFRGTMPWPASAKTEAQRKALVWRWYLKRLTDQSEAAIREDAKTVVSPTLLTYAGLPSTAVVGNASPPNVGTLVYTVTLRPAASGLAYNLSGFDYNRGRITGQAVGLEQALAADSVADRPALSALCKRLAAATAGW